MKNRCPNIFISDAERINLQKELLKTEKNHDEIDEKNWTDKRDEWVDYVKNDVLCSDFSYARNSEAMEEITGFGMKDCLP